MSHAIVEHRFICPYCWESITMLLDLSVQDQSYVEDCEVCCNPWQLRVTGRGEDRSVEVSRADE